MSPATTPRPPSFGGGFRAGFTAPLAGWRYMRQRPGLWRHGLLPLLLNLLITAVVFVMLVATTVWLVPRTLARIPPDWYWLIVKALVVVGLFALAAGIAVILWFVLGGVLCGYYYGKLALAVELELGTPAADLREIPISYQVVDTIRDILSLLLVNLGLLLLNVIPLLGSAAAFVGGLYFDWLIFGADFFDYPLELRGWRRDQKRAFVRAHRAQTLGLGAVTFLFSLVPILGAVILTTAVTGAVLLHQRLARTTAA